jgi:hypothetical protein
MWINFWENGGTQFMVMGFSGRFNRQMVFGFVQKWWIAPNMLPILSG